MLFPARKKEVWRDAGCPTRQCGSPSFSGFDLRSGQTKRPRTLRGTCFPVPPRAPTKPFTGGQATEGRGMMHMDRAGASLDSPDSGCTDFEALSCDEDIMDTGRGWARPESAAGPRGANPASTTHPSPCMVQSAAACAPPGLQGWHVGSRYRLVRLLGHGSYGEVAEGWDALVGRRVAIKRMRGVFDNDTDARRVYRELHILRRLSEGRGHPNVVRLLDVVAHASAGAALPQGLDELYLVLEYVDTDLHKLILSPQQLTNEHVETFVYQMLLALKFVQSAHVIHRDLKPANILLNEDCSLKLCDFGLARVVGPRPPEPPKGKTSLLDVPPEPPRFGRRQLSLDAREEEWARNRGGAGKRLVQPHCGPGVAVGGPRGGTALPPPPGAAGPGQAQPRLRRQLTRHVVTRWYRAPELILLQDYSQAVDVWSLGCILAELLGMMQQPQPQPPRSYATQTPALPPPHPPQQGNRRAPLFPGKSCYPLSVEQPQGQSQAPAQAPSSSSSSSPVLRLDQDQLNVILEVLGTPSEEDLQGLGLVGAAGATVRRYLQQLPRRHPRRLADLYPHADPHALDLLAQMLRLNPERRITVDEALRHPFLQKIRDSRLEHVMAEPIPDVDVAQLGRPEIKRRVLEEAYAFRRLSSVQ